MFIFLSSFGKVLKNKYFFLHTLGSSMGDIYSPEIPIIYFVRIEIFLITIPFRSFNLVKA